MAQKTVIIDIVRRLDRGVSRYVRRHLTKQQKSLYDFLSASNFPEDLDKASEAVGVKGNALAAIKSKLEDKVLELIGNLAERGTPHQRLDHLRLQARALEAMGQPAQAKKVLQVALDHAMSVENFSSASHFEALLRLRYSVSQSRDSNARPINLAKLQCQVLTTYAAMHEAEELKSCRNSRKEHAQTLLSQLQASQEPSSTIAQVFQARAIVICQVLLRNITDACQVSGRAINLLQEKSALLHDTNVLEAAVALILANAGALATIGDVDAAIGKLESFASLLSKQNIALPIGWPIHRLRLKIAKLAITPSDSEFLAEIELAQQAVSTLPAEQAKAKAQLIVYVAVKLLERKQYPSAQQWLSVLATLSSKAVSPLFHALGAILLAICLVEMNETADLDTHIRRCKRWLQKDQASPAFTQALLSALRAFQKGDKPKSTIFQTLALSLGHAHQDEGCQPYFESFDFQAWATR